MGARLAPTPADARPESGHAGLHALSFARLAVHRMLRDRILRRWHDCRLASADRRPRCRKRPPSHRRPFHGHCLPRPGNQRRPRRFACQIHELAYHLFAFAAAGSNLLLGKLYERSFIPEPQGLLKQIRQATSTHDAKRIYLLALATGFLLLGTCNLSGSYLQKVSGLDPLQTGGIIMFFGLSCLLVGRFSGSIGRSIRTKKMFRDCD